VTATVAVAASADLHLGIDSAGCYRPGLSGIDEADLFVVAGDLTRVGTCAEAEVVAGELADLPVPTLVVLGNHDVHNGEDSGITRLLQAAGLIVLDGTSATVDTPRGPVGVAGTKGFGNGFPGASASAFGEPVMKQFVAEAEREAAQLDRALSSLPEDVVARIALTHVAPTETTLEGEPPAIHAFLGSYLLGEVIDRHGVDLAVHGHAHRGTERGRTVGGVPVRNAAWPVTHEPFVIYHVPVRSTVFAHQTTG
jgi:Icc-related predicted phosphoesterase